MVQDATLKNGHLVVLHPTPTYSRPKMFSSQAQSAVNPHLRKDATMSWMGTEKKDMKITDQKKDEDGNKLS